MKVIETSRGRGEGVQRPKIKNCKGVWVEGGGGRGDESKPKKKTSKGKYEYFLELHSLVFSL